MGETKIVNKTESANVSATGGSGGAVEK
jgi:hypothetical protein